jgi:hypothetical protein
LILDSNNTLFQMIHEEHNPGSHRRRVELLEQGGSVPVGLARQGTVAFAAIESLMGEDDNSRQMPDFTTPVWGYGGNKTHILGPEKGWGRLGDGEVLRFDRRAIV